MARLRHGKLGSAVDADLDAALEVMDAEQLRELVRTLVPWLDDSCPW